MSSRRRASISCGVASFVFAGAVACGGKLERVPEANVDATQKAAAQSIDTRIWEGCNTGQHPALRDDEAIKEMQTGLSPEMQAATCTSIKGQFGDYQSMDYAETWTMKSGNLVLYRFKGRFSKVGANPPEIRVVMDGSKLSGLWLKPWTETPQ